MRVLGVDPGTRTTGWGLIEVEAGKVIRVAWGCLRGRRGASRPQTLAQLAEGLQVLLAQWQPDAVAVETPFVARFQKASLLLAETRGALLAALGRWCGAVAEYEPARVKAWVVGSGRAEKQQVSWLVQKALGIDQSLPPDAGDALAVALCHLLESRNVQLR